MAFGDSYILQIAQETQNALIVGFHGYLCRKLRHPALLAAETENMAYAVFSKALDWPMDDILSPRFVEPRLQRIESETKKLADDRQLCEILSAAAYNIGYGYYVMSGGGRLMNSYLGFMRIERRARMNGHKSDWEVFKQLAFKLNDKDPKILKMYHSLSQFGLWIPRPDSPNERQYYDSVNSFAHQSKI